MNKNIQVANYTKNGFSIQDANIVASLVDKELADIGDDDTLILDFTGVKFFTTLFFNTSLSRLLENMSEEEYNKKINVVGLTDVGVDAYKHSISNAVDYYSMTEEQRKEHNQTILDILNEEQE